jgi:hypothetical protein
MPSKAQKAYKTHCNGNDLGEIPSNIEAERVAIGYHLVGNPWRDDIGAHDFAGDQHRTIWNGMRAVHEAGDAIDRLRLAAELGEKQLQYIGGLAYLNDVADGCYLDMKIDSFVVKLREATMRRRLFHQLHIISSHLRTGDCSVGELIEMGVNAFTGMQTGGRNGRFTYVDVPSIWTWEADVSWIVDELIPEGAITLITGDSGCGKTLFATAMAGAVAKGLPFLGRSSCKRRILYCDRENPAGVVKKHLHDLHIAQTPDLTFWGNWCAHEADGPESSSLLQLARNERPVLIFDLVIAFNPGDEQSSNETRAFMQHTRNLAAAGASPVLLHHVGKTENAKLYRGSSDYKASVDVAFLLEKLGDPAGPLKDLRLVPFKNRFGGSTTLPLSFKDGGFYANQRGETCQEIMERLVRDNPGEGHRSLVAMGREAGMAKHQAEYELSRGAKQGRFEVRKAGRSHGYYLREGSLEGL